MIKAIDFFCGAGGLTRGLLDAGIKVLAGVDHDPMLQKTYEANNSPSRFICKKVEEITIVELRKELKIQECDRVLYTACTPCQPFSTLNQKRGKDERKELLLNFARLVHEVPPHFIVVENVPGLNNAYGIDVHGRFMTVLDSCGFRYVFQSMLDAKEYGVPQIRKRFIMLASRIGPIIRPKRSLRTRTVRDQIAKFPPLKDAEDSKEYVNHVARPMSSKHRAIVELVPKNGGSRTDIVDTSVLLECHKRNPKLHKDVFSRMAWDEPSPTLTCRCADVYCGRFVHPEQNRGISLREAAALQTFPDNYEFHGTSFTHISSQIGNAVPVELAKRLGRAIILSDTTERGR